MEIDFHDVVQKKTKIIESNEKMSEIMGEAKTVLGSKSPYRLFASDVREGSFLKEQLAEAAVDFSLPTLVLTECLLIYMKKDDSQGVIQWVSEAFTGDLAFVNYEMINPDDQFGRMMVENLENRGCQLLGIHDCPTLQS